ncbi:MAG: homoserine kinase [Frankiales bacterium]|nr:homoserine kinase [Frankiales bacterium]
MAGPAFRGAPVRVRVPATSANLGPGFDALGLALGLWDDVVVQVTDAGLQVDVAGEGAETVRRDKRNLVVHALFAAFDAMGGRPRGMHVVCANRIPHSRGLGSSAAAIVAGICAARALVVGGAERLDNDATLRLAARLEGHPDNVAACLLGGLTVAWQDDGADSTHALRLEPAESLDPVVYIPTTTASTAKVRALLPAEVPHHDAALNAGRSALLVTALTARPDLLLPATEDRLHQSYRASAMPRTAGLIEKLRSGGRPAVVSGAGPAVLLFGDGAEPPAAPRGFVAHRLPVDREGARVLPIGE